MTYDRFFQALTRKEAPFDFQRRLAEGPWPDFLDIPTGLGKTAAVVVAWLWKRLHKDAETGRRLVYCLPMRTLVEQTQGDAGAWCEAAAPLFRGAEMEPPEVFVLMGGETEVSWDTRPGRSAILVGTQDMLLSRALNRGYGMSRYRWPMHYGLLHSDCLWVFDETQLMGVGVETSAQLQAFRDAFGVFGPARSLWMSATLDRQQLATVDHPEPDKSWRVHQLSPEERKEERTRARTRARKRLSRTADLALTEKNEAPYFQRVAERVAIAAESRGGLTLVVSNRVDRARALYAALRDLPAAKDIPCGLVHSRFRRRDRDRHEQLLQAEGARVVVATQAVEAGVDVSARTLFSELAPWPSLVQRFGRCNRYGEADASGVPAEIHWIPIEPEDDKSELALPYEATELARAMELLEILEEQGGDAGPDSLGEIDYQAPPVVRPVLRRRDLLDLFDTTPDLLGYDLDVSRFVRDKDDTDVQFFWREFSLQSNRPPPHLAAPVREELCRVSIGAARRFLPKLEKERRRLDAKGVEARKRSSLLRAWRWDALQERWERVGIRGGNANVRPGETLLLHVSAEGYDSQLGWTGEWTGQSPVPAEKIEDGTPQESHGSDALTYRRRWVLLRDHLTHVEEQAGRIAEEAALDDDLTAVLATAARWHDVGKAHDQFQRRLLGPVEEDPERRHPGTGPWAKSDHHQLRAKDVRPYFRHELASALAWLALRDEDDARQRDLIAFLIATHHGRVHLALRSLPKEERPKVPDTLFACGVWDGDEIEGVELPGGEALPTVRLDLSVMPMGEGSWAERMLGLRDDPDLGPFRLAYLEALLRAADSRASALEAEGAYEESIDA